ncbi:MAG TPA: hypothetical protein VE553_05995 [Candidatus Binatia bacterium]|jgi:hypothetical protein|nr:hypothetical protein [Candidatus Binatia bacterium]
MIRPFSLRDLALVRRLGEHGICLDAESALTRSHHPLRGALFGLIGNNDAPTFVWRSEDGRATGFIQLQVVFELSARLVFIALEIEENGDGEVNAYDEDVWLPLLDEVVGAIGRRGLHSLVAEVDELGNELSLLRRAGFAIYTRQDIWMLAQRPAAAATTQLQRHQAADEWDVEWLYANTVPPLIQLVEPSPPQDGELWLLRENGELSAFVHLARGTGATWLQIFIHPNAYAQADDIVAAAAQILEDAEDYPLYCCVRRYQSWLQSALERSGFQRFKSQAVMVKHMSMPVAKKAGALDRLLHAQGVRPTTLLQRYHPEPPPPDGWQTGFGSDAYRVRKLIDRDAEP